MVTARRAPAPMRRATAAAGHDGATNFQVRDATAADLDTVNRVVVEAVKSWGLPARVHRLATPSLTYDVTDLAHMSIVLLSDANDNGIGVAAWEEASCHHTSGDTRAILLHGLYVVPHYQRMGVGTRLTGMLLQWAAERDFDGVIVRAWRDALPFFCSIGFEPIADTDQSEQYPRKLWRSVPVSSRQRPPASAMLAEREANAVRSDGN